jgi:Lrp/AsnC family transcriptional regulator
MEKIDTLDRKILSEIQRDAALPLDEIGARVGLSRNAVWRRVRALEGAGVIRGRVTLLAPAALGLSLMVFIQVRTDRHDPEWLDGFARATRDMPEILSVYRMTGELDYLIRARVGDMAGYDALYQRLIRRVPMHDVAASFVMEEIKDTTELPL